jgi:hypothetical protein
MGSHGVALGTRPDIAMYSSSVQLPQKDNKEKNMKLNYVNWN